MRVLRRVVVVAAVLLVIRSITSGADYPAIPAKPVPGTFLAKVQSQGYARTAYVHIPKGYDQVTPPPLVLALHGGGGDGSNMLEANGWVAQSDKHGFLLVCPNGLPALPGMPANFRANPPVWNSGQLKPGAPRTRIDDVAFVRLLLDQLASQVPFDPARLFVTGHSNGGGMSFRLASEMPERVAAMATVAGIVAVTVPQVDPPMPTLYIYGTKDPLLPMAGGESSTPWGSRKTPPVQEALSGWAAMLGCAREPLLRSENGDTRQFEYVSETNGPSLTAYFLEGHGHHWPGTRSVLPETVMGPNKTKLNATETIWEFFERSGARGE